MTPPGSMIAKKQVSKNLLARLEALEREVRELKKRPVVARTLAEITQDLGDMRAGRFISAADGSTGSEPTDPDFGGTVQDSDGVHGINAGTVQFELASADGKAKFARGSAVADKDGLLMTTGSPFVLDDGNDMAVFGMLPGSGAYMLSALAYSRKTLTNPNFENGDLTGWTVVGGPVAASQEQVQDGAWAAKFTGAGVVKSSDYIITTKKAFLLDFWLYAAGLTGYPQISASLEVYNGSNVQIDYIGNSFFLNSVGMWQRFIIPLRTSFTPAKVKITISAGGADPQYLDNIRLLDVTQLMAISHDSSIDSVRMTTQAAFKDFFPVMSSSDASQLAGQIAGNGLQGTIAAGGTQYVGAAGFITADANAAVQVNAGCVLKRLYVRTRSAQPATGTLVFDVMVDGVASGITVTVPAGNAAQLFTDATNTVELTTGRRVSLRAVNNAAAASAQIAAWSIGLFK